MKTMLRILTLVASVAVATVLTSCATTHHHHEEDHAAGRLVAALGNGTVVVLDVDGEVVKAFPGALPEGDTAVYSNASGTIAYLINRKAHTVLAVHSGQHLSDHEGHEDLELEEPALLGTLTKGLLPTHFNTLEGRSVVYNDESGSLTVIDERVIEKDGLEKASSFAPATVDHGAMILLPEGMFVGTLQSPDVVLMDYQGRVKKSFPGAVGLHGQTRLGRYSAFGLATGVMVLTQQGSDYSARVIPNPAGTPEKARVGTLESHPVHDFLVGNLGDGLALIDPKAGTIVPVALGNAPWRFGFDRSGQFLVVLGQDGALRILDGSTQKVLHTLPVVPARDPEAPVGTPVPALALGSKHAFVSAPNQNAILVIDLDEGEVHQTIPVSGGTLVGLDVLITDGVVHE